MTKELKYSDEDVESRVKELFKAEVDKFDKEGTIETLKNENAELKASIKTLEDGKDEFSEKLTSFDGYKSPNEVVAEVAEALEAFVEKTEMVQERVDELTEAGIEIDDELKNSLIDMDDATYALVKKVASAKIAEETPEKEEVEEIETPAKASEKETEDLPNGAEEEEEDAKSRVLELVGKAIKRNR